MTKPPLTPLSPVIDDYLQRAGKHANIADDGLPYRYTLTLFRDAGPAYPAVKPQPFIVGAGDTPEAAEQDAARILARMMHDLEAT